MKKTGPIEKMEQPETYRHLELIFEAQIDHAFDDAKKRAKETFAANGFKMCTLIIDLYNPSTTGFC